jgi:hypothetical protein
MADVTYNVLCSATFLCRRRWPGAARSCRMHKREMPQYEVLSEWRKLRGISVQSRIVIRSQASKLRWRSIPMNTATIRAACSFLPAALICPCHQHANRFAVRHQPISDE